MKSVLFVDDEPKVLKGLENSLYYQRNDWEMAFVTSAEAALSTLEERRFDVIVSDMRMPEMDGAELLVAVQERFPDVVRIVLSAHAEFEAVLRSVPVAHHFLVKPCETEKIVEAIQRACVLHELVQEKSIAQVVAKTKLLPTLPRTYQVLTEALADPEKPLGEIALVVEQDVSLCAKVLRLANSAALGLRNPVANVKQAVTYMGMNMIKNLVLAVETFAIIENTHLPKGFSFLQMQRHSLVTAGLAKKLVKDRFGSENAYMAGILHDIGKLILLTQIPEKFGDAIELAQRDSLPMQVAEKQILGVSHAEVGAYLLGLWGLPYPIVEAVAFHHRPRRVPQRNFDTLGSVYIANLLAHEQGITPHVQEQHEPIDLHYLKSILVNDKLSEWRQIAMEIAQGT